MVFVLRTANDAMALADPARKVIQGMDAELPVSQVRTMETVIRQTFASQQFSAVLLGGFSLASLLLPRLASTACWHTRSRNARGKLVCALPWEQNREPLPAW